MGTLNRFAQPVSRSLGCWAVAVLTIGGIAAAATPAAAGPQVDNPATQSDRDGSRRTISAGTIQFKLVVKDLDKSSTFYRAVFQARQAMRFTSSMDRRPMDEVLLESANGELLPLVLIKFLDGSSPTHTQAVLVNFTDDIDAFLQRVERGGGRLSERRDDLEHKARIAFWYDPEGNLGETVQML